MHTTILMDLRKQLRALPAVGGPVGRTELFMNIGYWICDVKDPLEREFWTKIFIAELEAKHPDIMPLMCRAYVLAYIDAARKQVYA